jgi:hypothetical protein
VVVNLKYNITDVHEYVWVVEDLKYNITDVHEYVWVVEDLKYNITDVHEYVWVVEDLKYHITEVMMIQNFTSFISVSARQTYAVTLSCPVTENFI